MDAGRARFGGVVTGSNALESFPLYHWSPVDRRRGIIRHGLVPGRRSICGEWRPPYIAFADDPEWAWKLSGGHPRGAHVDLWDLWVVWTEALDGYETIPGSEDRDPHEYRVYARIFKRDLFFVGTRHRRGEFAALP